MSREPRLVDIAAEALRLRKALETLVNRLDFVHEDDAYKGVWVSAHLRFGAYNGPTYEKELKAARAALSHKDHSS